MEDVNLFCYLPLAVPPTMACVCKRFSPISDRASCDKKLRVKITHGLSIDYNGSIASESETSISISVNGFQTIPIVFYVQFTCLAANWSHVLLITSKRFPWFAFVVFTLMNMSSNSTFGGFGVIVSPNAVTSFNKYVVDDGVDVNGSSPLLILLELMSSGLTTMSNDASGVCCSSNNNKKENTHVKKRKRNCWLLVWLCNLDLIENLIGRRCAVKSHSVSKTMQFEIDTKNPLWVRCNWVRSAYTMSTFS